MPTEIPEVRLTAKQRLVLMDIANEGSKERIDDNPRIVLLHLGLITKCRRFTDAERKARQATRKKWGQEVISLLREGKFKDASRKASDIEDHLWHDTDQSWYLTPAAKQYIASGTVTVVRGKGPIPDGK
jgi:hypothetical protein